jgi:DNA-directed RNA polymerase sigma subunit (sigma70/sigma32)
MLNEYSYQSSDIPEEQSIQNSGETDSLKQYLREIGRYDLLTEDEVKTLFKRIEAGDKAAHDVVVEHNLRLVVKYAKSIKKAYRAEESIMDLV